MKLLLATLCLVLLCCTDSSTSPAKTAADAEAADATPDAGAAGAQDAARPVSSADAARAAADADVAADGGALGDDAGDAFDAGSPEDARVADAAAGDGSYGGASRCDGLKFCDDFEGAQLDALWQNKTGSLELDGTKAMRGSKSLHVHTTNNTPAIMAHRSSFPMPNERFWVRMFVNIHNLPTPNWAHWSVLWTIPQGNQWSVEEHRFGGQNQSDKKLYWAVGTDHGSSGDWTNIDTGSTVQLDRWTCVELLIDANQDVSQVFRDGVEYPALGTTRSTKHQGNSSVPYDIPAVRTLWLGFFYYQGETPGQSYDLWIDSFALDGERIGCDR